MPDYNNQVYDDITLSPLTVVDVMKNHAKYNELGENGKKVINDFENTIKSLIDSEEPFDEKKRKELLDFEGKLAMAIATDPAMAVLSENIDVYNAFFNLIKKTQADFSLGKTVFDEESKTYKYIKESKYVSYNEFMKTSLEGFRELNQMAEDSQFQNKNLQDLYVNAENKAGYSKYEFTNVVEAQALKDLCMEYRAMSGKDPELEKILKKIDTYASLDAHANKNYKKETELIKEIMADLDKYADTVLEQQDKLTEEISNSDTEELDQQLTIKQELVENRLRIHGSLTSYFASLTPGNLTTPMDRFMDPNDDAQEISGLADANSRPYGKYEGKNYSYINGAGVSVKMEHDTDGYGKILTAAAKLGDSLSGEFDVRDMPIFPHEPRLNDIQQKFLGDCYALAGLQDVARLYPEKIKDMIRDNNDGTATVRFFEDNGKNGYKPLYVRVDKKEALMGGVFAAGAENCLWATLIERAYMISGLHPSRSTGTVKSVPDKNLLDNTYQKYKAKEPLTQDDLNELEEKYPWLLDGKKHLKQWEPSLGSIEGGREFKFLETCFGADFAPHKLYDPQTKAEREKDWPEESEALYNKYLTDFNNVSAEQRMQKLMNLALKSETDVSKEAFYDSFYPIVQPIFKDDHQKFTEICDKTFDELSKLLTSSMKSKKGLFIDSKAFEKQCSSLVNQFGKNTFGKDSEASLMANTIAVMSDSLLKGVANFKTKSALFDEIYDSLQKGFPVSAGTPDDAPDVPETHAYSVIGAYKTKDNPPKMYLRIRNPWGGREGASGIEFTKDADGNPVAKKVSSKEGIFDMEFGKFLKNFDSVNVNKSPKLKNTVHKKTTGFEIAEKDKTDLYSMCQVDSGTYTDYLKFAHDIYSSLVDTNSVFSNDSESYKLLLAEAKNFNDTVAMSKGQDPTVITAALDKFVHKAELYAQHVEDVSKGSPSSRQIKRLKVCETIRQLGEKSSPDLEDARKEFEKDFAEKMVAQHCRNNNLDIRFDKIEEEAQKLTQNRAFRDVVNKMNINKMVNADEKILTGAIKDFQKITQKIGVEKVYDAEKQKSVEFQKSV